MITEDRMRTLFAQANPIPDAGSVELDDLSGAAYLATLERSSEMTQIDLDPGATTKTRKPALWWIATAGLVLVLGVALILTAQSSQDTPPADQPIPVPSTTAPTATTLAVPTSLAAPEVTVPLGPTDAELVAISTEWLSCVSVDCKESIESLSAEGLVDELPITMADHEGVGSVLVEVNCEAVELGGTLCTRITTDAVSRVWGWEYEETFRFFFDGTMISSYNWGIDHPDTIDAYVDWLDRNYGTEYGAACTNPPEDPEACIAFLESHTTEFEQSDSWVPPEA